MRMFALAAVIRQFTRRLCRQGLFPVLLLVLVLLAASCGQTPAAPTSSPMPSEPATAQMPTPFDSPLATPTLPADALESPLVTPTPLSPPMEGTGHVVGRFVRETDGEPMPSAYLFLGELLSAEGPIPGVGLVPGQAPETTSDANGEFAFLNVPPGRYALIWWLSHRESYLLRAPEGAEEEFLIVNVEEGTTTELGDVSANQP